MSEATEVHNVVGGLGDELSKMWQQQKAKGSARQFEDKLTALGRALDSLTKRVAELENRL